jgi:hypothetical protein
VNELVLEWGIPVVVVVLILIAFFAPRKGGSTSERARTTAAPGEPLRVSVSPAVLGERAAAALAPEPQAAVAEPPASSEPVHPHERLRALQDGPRDVAVLHALLSDSDPAIRAAALDIALDWHDLDAVSSAMSDPVISIAALAALEYAARTSQAACDAELNALDPAHAARVRERLALTAF